MANNVKYRTMEEFELVRWGIIILVMFLIAIASICAWVFTTFWGGLMVGAILTIWFAYSTLHTFSSNPPTKWIPLVMGVYVNGLKGYGPTLIPLPGSLGVDYTQVPGGIMHVDFDATEMIPDDRVTVVIGVDLRYEIDDRNPVQVIMLGGVPKAAELLQEYIDKLLRQWVTHPERGPEKLDNVKMTLDRVRRMSNEAVNYLLEELVRDDIATIHSDIPIEALMGIFAGRPLSPREKQDADKVNAMSEAERRTLREAVERRIEDIDALRKGNKPIRIQSTGLVIRQMIIDQIEPDKANAELAKKVAAANFDAEIKTIGAKNLAERAQILKDVTTHMDPTEAALIQDGTVKKTIQVTKFDVADSVLDATKGLGAIAIDAFKNLINKGKEVGNGGNTDNGK